MAGRDEAALVGEHDRLYSVAKAELREQMRDVGLDRPFTEEELLGELGVALAGGEEP